MSEPKPDRPLHESEQDQIGSTLSLLNALGAIGHSGTGGAQWSVHGTT